MESLLRNNPKKLLDLIEESEAILVGVGAGMSAADGFTYVGKRFTDNFSDFIEKYHWLDLFQASVFKFETLEEEWAFFSRFVDLNYFSQPVGKSFLNLKKLLENKTYHIITSNADSAFEKAKFDMNKVLHVQGKYNLMQCPRACNTNRYKNDNIIHEMIKYKDKMSVPSHLIPYCPECSAPLELNRRNHGDYMIEDEEFSKDYSRYENFLKKYEHSKILLLELGCGYMAPQVIKHPFQDFVARHINSTYCTVNIRNYNLPNNIKEQTVWIKEDISALLEQCVILKKEKI